MIQISNMKIKRNMKYEVYCVLFTAHQFLWGSGNVLFFCSSNPQASQAYCDTWILHSTDYRDLGKGKRYQTSIERIMSNHGSTEEIANRSSSEIVEGEIPEIQTLTQEAVNEQIRGFIAPLTRQLEELTRLVQGMTTSRHPNSYPKTDLGTTAATAMPQSDIIRKHP